MSAEDVFYTGYIQIEYFTGVTQADLEKTFSYWRICFEFVGTKEGCNQTDQLTRAHFVQFTETICLQIETMLKRTQIVQEFLPN